MRKQVMAVAMSLGATPAVAQMSELPDEITSTSALESAAQTMAEEVEDRLLIRDLLDEPVVGEDESEIGTVEDFAVVPGSGFVAAIVRTSDGGRLAIPLKAVKAGSAADGAPIEVPFAADEITDMDALSSLADALSR